MNIQSNTSCGKVFEYYVRSAMTMVPADNKTASKITTELKMQVILHRTNTVIS